MAHGVPPLGEGAITRRAAAEIAADLREATCERGRATPRGACIAQGARRRQRARWGDDSGVRRSASGRDACCGQTVAQVLRSQGSGRAARHIRHASLRAELWHWGVSKPEQAAKRPQTAVQSRWQVAARQFCPGWQALSHAPQCSGEVIVSTQVPPHAVCPAMQPPRKRTVTSVARRALVSSPSWPSVFWPQHRSAPRRSRAQAVSSAESWTALATPRTGVGVVRAVVVPTPIIPKWLAPLQRTRPSRSGAQEEKVPAASSTTSRRSATGAGVVWGFAIPVPRTPLLLRPQHTTAPSCRRAQVCWALNCTRCPWTRIWRRTDDQGSEDDGRGGARGGHRGAVALRPGPAATRREVLQAAPRLSARSGGCRRRARGSSAPRTPTRRRGRGRS